MNPSSAADAVTVDAPTVRLEIVPWLTRLFGQEQGGRIVREEPIRPGESIGAFLRRIGEDYPEFARVIWDEARDDLSEHVQIVLNDMVLEAVGPADTPLRPGDSVLLLPPYLGG
ncbi:MAG TPA: MoaD/ThiS family protein [Dehalococcoidia bacterium]|nr:MoaD/ThiS family protein [Dehalococcoidia bacterium]